MEAPEHYTCALCSTKHAGAVKHEHVQQTRDAIAHCVLALMDRVAALEAKVHAAPAPAAPPPASEAPPKAVSSRRSKE